MGKTNGGSSSVLKDSNKIPKNKKRESDTVTQRYFVDVGGLSVSVPAPTETQTLSNAQYRL
jgi:hypothetical protein